MSGNNGSSSAAIALLESPDDVQTGAAALVDHPLRGLHLLPTLRVVASFANGVDRDISAVRAAITSGWSNGQIIKLKLVKRQMYGCGKLDLLEAGLLGHAT